MANRKATLYLLCGKIAAGKSSLASLLARENNAILISQDDWLATLYPDDIATLEDYRRFFARLSAIMGPHVQELLSLGQSVVFDFPANTPQTRDWMKSIFTGANCRHELHYLDVPDEVCKTRLRKRNAEGLHKYKTSDADFDLFTSYFVAPDPSEGFQVVRHTHKK